MYLGVCMFVCIYLFIFMGVCIYVSIPETFGEAGIRGGGVGCLPIVDIPGSASFSALIL